VVSHTTTPALPLRTTLYVPGNQPDKLAKSLTSGADAIICDLEDAVAPSAKDLARSTIVDFISAHSDSPSRPAVFVRVNWGSLGIDDLRVLVPACGRSLAGIYLPKVSSVDEIRRVDEELMDLERSGGLGVGTTRLVALLETAQGILDAGHASCHRRGRPCIRTRYRSFAR
jgi:citrate lyase subunit beta / citryl-CoA lyase